MYCLFDIFEKYQTFIVGVIGFLGVIYTIHMNAKLTREQHTRELKHEANSLRVALIEELDLLISSYKDRIEMLNTSDRAGSACFSASVHNQVYLQLLSKLGVLSTTEIKPLMRAYQLTTELPNRLLFLAEDYDDRNISIHNSQYDAVIQLHKNFLIIMEKAQTALKNNVIK